MKRLFVIVTLSVIATSLGCNSMGGLCRRNRGDACSCSYEPTCAGVYTTSGAMYAPVQEQVIEEVPSPATRSTR